MPPTASPTARTFTLSDFDFVLPEPLIAQHPTPERSGSRLLDGTTTPAQDRIFRELPHLLRAGDLMVFNDTKVLHARLFGEKATGGKVELLVERVLGGNQVAVHMRVSKKPEVGATLKMVSRVTQGCKPVSKARVVTEVDHNVVVSLDGEPALDVMLSDLGVSLDQPQEALAVVRATLVGLVHAPHAGHANQAIRQTGNFGSDVVVRHIIGLDPARRGVAVAQQVEAGTELSFCRRNVQAARADLTRICAEIREELEPEELPVSALMGLSGSEAESQPHPARGIAGAIYVSCSGRGGPHFGGPSAELQIVRRALGDVPLVGFFAGGEIARQSLYGYTGVLTVFTTRD